MSTRTRLAFDIQAGPNGEHFRIHIADPSSLSADNLALSTWGSSQVLANLLHRLDIPAGGTPTAGSHDAPPPPPPLLPVLELGAGTGLVGLSAAALWHRPVWVTDLAPLVPNLAANVRLNGALVERAGGEVACGTLDWSRPDVLRLSAEPERESRGGGGGGGGTELLEAATHPAQVILAADTVYSEEHPELLTRAIRAWLAPGARARVVFCYPLRVGYLDHIRDLWARMEGMGLECAEEGRESIDASWDEDTPYEWCVWRWKE